jgi:hypothetical protein
MSEILPGTGRGTARRSRGVEGAPCLAPNPLHHDASRRGPPPRSGEDFGA